MIITDLSIADYCIRLHRRNTEQLGLLPKDRMRWYVERDQVFTAREGGDLCGYLIAGMKAPWARIWQACVEFSLRGLGHGRNLVEQLRVEALRRGCSGITLRCRDGMDANWFWSALGFIILRTVLGGGRRNKPLNVWVKRIGPDLFGSVTP